LVVLQEEDSAQDKAVGDVVAIYAKVEEVRDAVNQLEQGNGSTGRSETLPEVMDSTKEKLVEEPKQPKVSESATASDKKESADLSLAHEALTSLSKITKVNNRLQFKMKDQWAETLFNLKLIVNRLKLEWTPELAKEMRALLAALSDACSKNDVLRLRAQLESLEMNMPQAICYYNGYQVVG
ncbi:hypothetical protein JG688_00005079, partial [Phytophthora aleatoria]